MRTFYKTIDTIVWGRRTYDWLLNYSKRTGKTKGLIDTKVANHVFSRKPPRRALPGARQSVLYLCHENILEYHSQVRRNGLAIPDPEATFNGISEFRLDDPDGNRLWIRQNTPTT
jgi:hypothetical protein